MASDIEPRIASLIDAGISLAAELDLDTLLQRIADLARDVIQARYAAVGVLGDRGELQRFIYSGIDEKTVDAIGHLPEGKGVLGVIIEGGRPLRLREIANHPRSHGFPEHHPTMHSFLGVPIMVGERVFGRLYLTEKETAEEFSKDDERMALMFAAQAGVAIENARLYDEVKARGVELARRMTEMASLQRLSSSLIGGGSVDEALASALDEARTLTRSARAVLFLAESDGDLVVRTVVGGDTDLVGSRIARDTSKAHGVLERGIPEMVDEMARDPEVRADVYGRLGAPHDGAFAPVTIEGRPLGVVAAFDRSGEAHFTEDDLTALQIVANQIAILLENERLASRLQDLAVLEERERISKELHDGVIQAIYSVGLTLQGSIGLLEKDPQRARHRLDYAIEELDGVVRDVRNYIFALQPAGAEEREVTGAIRELASVLEVNTLATTEVDLDEEALRVLPDDRRRNLVMIVREILSNVARHARASSVLIRCSVQAGRVEFMVEDDGAGFDPDTVERGHGLSNMEKRAQEMGATLEVIPGEDRGTRHRLTWTVEGDG